jgi:hypothetical protein
MRRNKDSIYWASPRPLGEELIPTLDMVRSSWIADLCNGTKRDFWNFARPIVRTPCAQSISSNLRFSASVNRIPVTLNKPKRQQSV